MRIVVGTLYCGENEFSDCCAAVARQSLPPVDHFVLSNLPKREAHMRLYREFADRADSCDLFIKLDADMVIISDTLFEGIAKWFSRDPELDHLRIVLNDFFSQRLIGALNCFRSCCRWEDLSDSLYTDAPPVNRRKVHTDWSELAPAAFHCRNPSGFQAFHFGLHKGLKVREAVMTRQGDLVHRHWVNIELTWKHFLSSGDAQLLLACVGAELALAERLLPADVDYGSAVSRREYEHYQSMSPSNLQRRVRWLRCWNRRFFPAAWRERQLAFGWKLFLSDLLSPRLTMHRLRNRLS